MGETLAAVLDEIGYVDKKLLMEASEKIAKFAKEAELAKLDREQSEKEKARAEIEKARIEAEKARIEAEKAQVEAENTDIRKNLLEAAFDMLQHGTPPALISKWTSLPEDVILRLKADIEISFDGSLSDNKSV